MDKRTLLAVVLSAVVLLGYYALFPITAPQSPTVQSDESAQKEDLNTSEVTLNKESGPSQKAEEKKNESQKTEEVSSQQEKTEEKRAPLRLSSLKTAKVSTELSSHTGLPTFWKLNDFFQNANNKGPHTNLLEGSEKTPPMQLLLFAGKESSFPDYEEVEKTEKHIKYRSAYQGLQLEQIVTTPTEDYSLKLQLNIKNLNEQAQTIKPGLRILTKQREQDNGAGFLSFLKRQDFITPLHYSSEGVERQHSLKDITAYQEGVGDISWSGLEDRYFLRGIIADSSTGENLQAYGVDKAYIFSDFRYPEETLSPGSEKEYHFTLYLGPKNPTYLNSFSNVHLNEAIDYGWFAVVARPILWLLKFFESFIGNWGIAIIILTVFIKLLMHPLTKKSMQSMKAMQKLQPKLKELREKHKDNRERLNMETMNLFKTHKVNPMGGCLPMVLQMPIYFALYKVLFTATELYHAPFFGPYQDLSAPDPYFVLPVLLGVMMVLQQKLTPTAGDPSQAKMMMIMPIMFSVFMLFLPVGLVVYIFVNTVMTVIQQYMHHRDLSFLELFKGRKAST
ncbi:MAG: membrane protein insertase YidC [Deltaproteobacteria bacterium]|nr:membrane protein insertase YidC [Deltaproteobacteria bacterium]